MLRAIDLRFLICLAAFWVSAGRLFADEQLSIVDVQRIMAQATTEAKRLNPRSVVAIVDREGFVLGVWDVGRRLPDPLPKFKITDKNVVKIFGLLTAAITRAGTAAFLSSNQNAFTSRTAGFITQQHFPPGVRHMPTGPLVGVGLSSLFFSDVNRFKRIPPGFDPFRLSETFASPGARGEMIPPTTLNDSPGGVPLYKNGELVGGIGVTGDGDPTDLSPAAAILTGFSQRDATTGFKVGRDTDEEIALAGQSGYRPSDAIVATRVLINGIRLSYVDGRSEELEDIRDVQPLGTIGAPVTDYPLQGSPPFYQYHTAHLRGVGGEIRQLIRSDPMPGRIGKARRLDASEVLDILSLAAERCAQTRAGIRLPLGTTAKVFISVVNNPHQNGARPQVLGVFRVGEATMFSWDVAVQKARTAVFFSNKQLAQSSRTVGFLAQRFFPPGLDGRPHGPYFGFQEAVSLKADPNDRNLFPGNKNLPNGITIFPGGFPLYRDGELVGAIGVSGDGVDQDDLIAASGCANFLAPRRIRADSYTYRGARLPYAKFPRDPQQ